MVVLCVRRDRSLVRWVSHVPGRPKIRLAHLLLRAMFGLPVEATRAVTAIIVAQEDAHTVDVAGLLGFYPKSVAPF